MSTIKVNNITMKFKDVVALDNVSVTFEQNKIYGLLGRNGAGKSTLLNLISNRIFPTAGEITVDGMSVIENEKALSKIYCMSEQTLYPEVLSVADLFRWTKGFYRDFDSDYANLLAEKFGLKTKLKIKNLSTGYASIVKNIIALASNAPIILLDEPVLGLDANHRDLLYREIIANYAETPRTIIISTHLIEEVADIIEKVVLIKDGRVIADTSVEEMLKIGYGVSGKADDVDAYIVGKDVLSVEALGGLKVAFIKEKIPEKTPDNLDISRIDLQKLFIQLTN